MADDTGTQADTELGADNGDTTETGASLSPEEEVAKWKSLARKHEAVAKKNQSAAAKLEEIEEKSKTELQKAQERAAEAERKAQVLELRDLQRDVASAKKLPAYMAGRLHGTTKAELEADADAILREIKGGKPADLRQGNNGKPTEPAKDMNDFIRGMRR